MLKYKDRKKELQEQREKKNEKYSNNVDAETYQVLCGFLNIKNEIKEVE